jgi:hypothetical protein
MRRKLVAWLLLLFDLRKRRMFSEHRGVAERLNNKGIFERFTSKKIKPLIPTRIDTVQSQLINKTLPILNKIRS